MVTNKCKHRPAQAGSGALYPEVSTPRLPPSTPFVNTIFIFTTRLCSEKYICKNTFCLQSITFCKAGLSTNEGRIILPPLRNFPMVPLEPTSYLKHRPWRSARCPQGSLQLSSLTPSSPQHLLPNLGQINLSFIKKSPTKTLPVSRLPSGVEKRSEMCSSFRTRGSAPGPSPRTSVYAGVADSFSCIVRKWAVIFPLYGNHSTPSCVCVYKSDRSRGGS